MLNQLNQEVKMLLLKKIVMLMAAVIFVVGIFGCEEKGTAEKAGQKIDKVFEDVKDKVKETAE
jgi:hyperosmotically inducible protein